ncbi:MAG: FapA family protein [Acetobacterium sp.]|nr:FapA family protein [Bacillota bacterium]MCG2730670.1 FapA family protein [Acetobacterium sp.]
MIEENAKIAESVNLIEVSISEDKQQGFIKLEKQEDGNQIFTKEELVDALKEQGIVYGIIDSAIDKLVQRPIYNIRIKVAEAKAPIDGEDGKVKLLVKKDDEYKPEYSEEDTIDYKNLSYFQMVKKGQILCEITEETTGLDGTNILGGTIKASKGKKPLVPAGKNTSLNEDETKLIADCDGIIKFVSTININEMLHITRNVDFSTGNIDFSGDVTIDGDVSSGFSVKAGGNLVIKGVVEEATKIEADGNVMISKGIYGGGSGVVTVKKDLRCNYIENALIFVEGDITVDYIIGGKITCKGNIFLSGSKELIVGGEIMLSGELIAKEIGNEREYPTIIRILGEKTIDEEALDKFNKKKEVVKQQLEETYAKESQVNELLLNQEKKDILSRSHDNPAMKQLANIKRELDKHVIQFKKEISEINEAIAQTGNDGCTNYYGSVSVKRKLYRGTRIYFGDMLFQFDLDTLEHCKIYWDNDNIVNGML